MKLSLFPFQLAYKFPFGIAHGKRTHTPIVFIKLELDGYFAWGEAALPPYLTETQKSVIDSILIFHKSMLDNTNPEDWRLALQNTMSNQPAMAALDMALWQLEANLKQTNVRDLLGISQKSGGEVNCFYTIGLGTKDEMRLKYEDGIKNGFRLFKLKLGGTLEDYKIVNDFLEISNNAGFAVDMNNAYFNEGEAEKLINFLRLKNCLVIEQALEKNMLKEMEGLKERHKNLLFADESCQIFEDIDLIKNSFDGINIKLMKCGGLSNALKMIKKAKELNLKTLIGCMSESAVGCTAAAQLAPLVDWVDLDGTYLISNDPFTGMKISGGSLQLYELKQLKEIEGLKA